MPLVSLQCPNCGAPLPPEAVSGTWVCAFCHNAIGVGAAPRFDPDREDDDIEKELGHLPRVVVAGQIYRLLGRLARGDSTDVFLGKRARRLTEMVVLKVLRSPADRDLLDREWRTLEHLAGSATPGAEHYARLLPQPVVRGTLIDPEGEDRPVMVYRYRSGFVHTLSEVMAVYGEGIDPRASVWMFRRVLGLLGWIHRSHFLHGAVIPPHLLVHPRDHGVVLVGFGSSQTYGAAASESLAQSPPLKASAGQRTGNGGLIARSSAFRIYYPDDVWHGAPATRGTDLVMAARCIVSALGGDLTTLGLPAAVPVPLAKILVPLAAGRVETDDAWEVMDLVITAAREAFGPPKYSRFTMPGWR